MIRLALAALMAAGASAGQDRVLSPSGRLSARYTMCTAPNPCIPQVIIANRDGSELRRFEVRNDQRPCTSILGLHWAGENAIAAECHENPSLSTYDEIDIGSGKVLREYFGYGFVRSPDYTKVAHVGWIVHFAPPWVKSEYLQIGNTIVYPLPAGMKPLDQKPLEMAPQVVESRGLVYAGVHEFRSEFAWSPDSRRVGFIDCLVDYRLRDGSQEAVNEGGQPENLRCFAVAVGLDGAFRRAPIPAGTWQEFAVKWTGAGTLQATRAGRTVAVALP